MNKLHTLKLRIASLFVTLFFSAYTLLCDRAQTFTYSGRPAFYLGSMGFQGGPILLLLIPIWIVGIYLLSYKGGK